MGSGGPGEVGRHSLRTRLGLLALPESQEGSGGLGGVGRDRRGQESLPEGWEGSVVLQEGLGGSGGLLEGREGSG